MPRKLKRHHGRGDLHFITFSCYERRALFGTVRARDVFLKTLEQVRRRFASSVVGYVAMPEPEHVHLLISEAPKATPSVVLRVLKQRVSRDLRRNKRRVPAAQLRLPFMAGGTALPRFWQPRFHDFNVFSTRKIREKLDYMHGNPVKRGLVKNAAEWMWSSFSYYEKGERGLVPIDPV